MIENLIETVINDPTDQNKNTFLRKLNELEYSLLQQAETFPYKSSEYFNKRAEAFSVRGKYAKMLLAQWVNKFNSTEGCPLKYEDTLNIPFRSIKSPIKDE